MNGAARCVFLYGAYGHTGRLVLDELRRRGWTVLLGGRDVARLREVAQGGEFVVAAEVHEADKLHAALRGSRAILNCAGPFADTAGPLVEAALRARVPYLDISGEVTVSADLFAKYDLVAKEAGILILPAVGFYGALGHLLVRFAAADWPDAKRVTLAIGLGGWQPTRGTRAVIERMAGRRWVYADGKLQLRTEMKMLEYHFPAPLGRQTVMADYPAPESVLIPRHLAVPDVDVLMTAVAVRDLRNPVTQAPTRGPDGRSDQRFLLHVQVERAGEIRAAVAQGRDIYATTAPILVGALEEIVTRGPGKAGVMAFSALVEPEQFLAELDRPFLAVARGSGAPLQP
jgi:short subunit dehydrogenase-like uncharacterized protein